MPTEHKVKNMNRLLTLGILSMLQVWTCSGTPLALSHSSLGAMPMPMVENMEVKCGRSGMNVNITFVHPFQGVIYSKGHFDESKCNYVTSTAAGGTEFAFLIPVDSCGTEEDQLKNPEQDMNFENTIIIQNDPLIQEVWDTAKRLSCTWKRTYSKSIQADPFLVQNPEMVKLDFDHRSINTLMEIQKGKSPFSSPATGYIYVRNETSVVIYLQDDSETLDANAVSCTASSSRSQEVELIDRNGCLVRPDLMSSFVKLKNPEGANASLMLYSYFKSFRVGDDPNLRISCQLEVCERSCLEPCALGPYSELRTRTRRHTGMDTSDSKTGKLERVLVLLRAYGTLG